MANITRFAPMRTLERFSPFEELERMLDTFRMRPVGSAMAGFGSDIRLEVSEDDKAYHVRAEMPGCSKDDIKIAVEGNQVSIAAEIKKEEQAEEGRSMLCSECHYGQMYRSFSLEQPVDDAKADAKYENGVLMLTLPKKAGGGAHKVSVH